MLSARVGTVFFPSFFHSVMARKFKFSVRKNKERKKPPAKNVESLPISIPIQVMLSAQAPSLRVLRQRIQALHVLPQGSITHKLFLYCFS